MAVRGEGRPSQIMRYLDVCFAKMYLYHELFLLIQVVVPPPTFILICRGLIKFFFCCLNVYMMNLKQIMSHVCNIMVREGWLSGEKGGHHRLCGISMYASPKCIFIMNYFYVYLYHVSSGLTELLTLTLVWEKVTRQCHMCVILW